MRDRDAILAKVSELRISGANESETRFQVIDEILHLLGWTKDDMEIERRTTDDGKTYFLDYVLKTGTDSILIEAKRISSFASAPDIRKLQLKSSQLNGPVREAINQARDYARSKSVGFCAVTDGEGWIFFPVNRRDFVTYEDSTCIIFKSAEHTLNSDFEEFKQLFARSSVIDGSLSHSLLGSRINQNETRRLNAFYDRHYSEYNRISVFSQVESEISVAFSEDVLTDNEIFMELFYVDTPDRTRFDGRIQMHIKKPDAVINSQPRRPLRGDLQRISLEIKSITIDTRPAALLTLGPVGVGKTTFLKFVEKISAKEAFAYDPSRPTGHWIYVDFRDFSPLSQNARMHIIEAVYAHILKHEFLSDYDKCLRFAYADEIKALKQGPLSLIANDEAAVRKEISSMIMDDFKQREPYCTKIMKYASRNAPVFLVIDNVDQIEKTEDQSNIFIESLALARPIGCNLILSMRENTYLKNQNNAIFNAYNYDYIVVDPPLVSEVLSKRFDIAKRLLAGRSINIPDDAGQKLTISDASQIGELLQKSVLSTEVAEIIDIAASGNIRLGLRMTRQFLQYGYSSILKALVALGSGENFRLPPHEAIRALMLGSRSVYNDDFSEIRNIFDSKLGNSKHQFLRLFVLSALFNMSKSSSFDGISVIEINKELEKLGYSENTSMLVLKGLFEKRLIFTKSHRELDRDSIVNATRFGGYTLHVLTARLPYVENALFDTFVFDDETWQKMKKLTDEVYRERNNKLERMRKRILLVKTFFRFCQKQYDEIHAEAVRRGLPVEWRTNVLRQVQPQFVEDCKKALASAKRNYGTPEQRSQRWRGR